FDLGAAHYVNKPLRFEQLLALISAQLLAVAPSTPEQDWKLSHRNVVVNLRTRLVYVGEQVVELSAREFTLVETFMSHPGQVLSREQLLDRVWGYDYSPGSNVVDVYVGYLRKKLGSDLIETVRGMGYRMPA
ncbi:MAG: response regulator transcription factor, partial [Leptolyngbya sp. SIO3F4]|nr:response regulator transcription factor [Leptolyngbya sp. SIO3F4]